MKAFVSWSGGKETSLSCYKVMQNQDVKVTYLLNMISEDGKHSRSHGINTSLLKAQAEAMRIPIVQIKTTWQTYEAEFKKAVLNFKEEGIKVGVFGDIDLQEHRDWVERVCKEICIKPLLPLWKEEREKLLEQFIRAGFKAIVVATNAKFLGEEWLGRQIDGQFIEDLKALGNIDLCGEKGEYHTFVYDGPIFKKPVKFKIGRKILKDNRGFLEIIPIRFKIFGI
ncbi:MAG: diphthine--ammonia ligase [Nitrospirota bacterium]